EDAARTELVDDCRHVVLVEVHVAERGDSRGQQLGGAEAAAEPDGVGMDELALGGPHVALEPDVERQVGGPAPEARPRRVGWAGRPAGSVTVGAVCARAMSPRGPTATMQPSRTASPPRGRIVRRSSIVTTIPPSTSRSAGAPRGCG